MAQLFRYAAFVSYSSKDALFARRLHRALESYGIPSSLGEFDLIGGGKKNRIYPVFRDREELSAGHLGDLIEANLKASAALIVVCSPNGAGSPWVQKEIEYFVGLGRRDKIFAIIADTAPLTDESGADCTATCFPPAFRGDALSGDKLEPLAADARKYKDGFRNAWLKVVAGIIGVTPGRLVDRDRRRRRAQTLQSIAVWAAVLLIAGTAFLGRNWLFARYDEYVHYQRFVHATADLAAATPGTTFWDCDPSSTYCPAMVVVPEGQFLMGSAPDDPENVVAYLEPAPSDQPDGAGLPIDTGPAPTETLEEQMQADAQWIAELWQRGGSHPESPQRTISIRRFAVSQYEVTIANWRVCVNAGGCGNFQPDATSVTGVYGETLPPNAPVTGVSWEDAQLYVNWLSRQTHVHYRLLTEAEWEYAARGQTSVNAPHTRFGWGDEDPPCYGNIDAEGLNNSCVIGEVEGFPGNAFSLHGMNGNAAEWVEDCFAPYDASRTTSDAVPLNMPNNDSWCYRVARGAGSLGGPHDIRSASRSRVIQHTRDPALGFRIARDL